eukprot:497379_1
MACLSCNFIRTVTQWRFILILSLSYLICNCKSQKDRYHVLDYTSHYNAYHYEFVYTDLIQQPHHVLPIGNATLRISFLNDSFLSYIVNDNINFNFLNDAHYDTISYKYNSLSISSTKRRMTAVQTPQKREKTGASGSWRLLLRIMDTRTSGRSYFDPSLKATGNENEDDPTKNTYSIFGTIARPTNYKDPKNNKYTFKLVYGNRDGSQTALLWKQSSWPSSSQTIHGFEKIAVPKQGANGKFKGLALSDREETYLDGNGDQRDWWNSVGTIQPYKDGIPAFNHKIAWSEALYVFRPPGSPAGKRFTQFKDTSNHLSTGTLVGDQQYRDFESAKALCKYHYGDMVSIRNDEDNSEVHTFCEEQLGGNCWIGLQAQPDPNTWNDVKKWVDGSEYGAYKRWSSGEPNNAGGREKCAEMRVNSAWDDIPCWRKKKTVCRKANPTEYGDFISINKKMTWSDAKQWCQTTYDSTAGLAIINGFSDNEDIRNACANIQTESSSKECWIGLRDTAHKFTRWSDDQGTKIEYRKWMKGTATSKVGYDCVAIAIEKDGTFSWKNKLCTDNAYFICQKDLNKPEGVHAVTQSTVKEQTKENQKETKESGNRLKSHKQAKESKEQTKESQKQTIEIQKQTKESQKQTIEIQKQTNENQKQMKQRQKQKEDDQKQMTEKKAQAPRRSRRNTDRERKTGNVLNIERNGPIRAPKEEIRTMKKETQIPTLRQNRRREDMTDMKQQILKEMSDHFSENNRHTMLFWKDLQRQTNEMTQRQQMEWQKQREEDRRQQKQHLMRLKEHEHLMNGIRGLLMRFNQLKRQYTPPIQSVPRIPGPQVVLPPPLAPPIPPIPRRRTLLKGTHRGVSKCVSEDGFGELCVTYEPGINVVAFDVTKSIHKQLKEKRYRDNIDKHMIMDEVQETAHVIRYRQFDYVLNETTPCAVPDINAPPLRVCMRMDDKRNDVVIYLDGLHSQHRLKRLIVTNEKAIQYMKTLKELEFGWMNDQNWDEVIHFETTNHVKKCKHLVMIKLCIEMHKERMFTVKLFDIYLASN